MKLIPSVQRALESAVEAKELNISRTIIKEEILYQHRNPSVPEAKIDDLDELEKFCFVLSSN